MHLLLRSLAYSVVLATAVPHASAQFPSFDGLTPTQLDESMKAQASSANIKAWLESKDPRLIAWGAYFAQEKNDDEALALAQQILKTLMYQVGVDSHMANGPPQEAVSAILDALIQQNVPLSADQLGYLSYLFPVQSAVLASRVPASETSSLLMQWYLDRNDRIGLSRPAAMLLSKSPTTGFAASMLANSEEELLIKAVANSNVGSGDGVSSGVACGDSLGSGRVPGWPELFRYELDENNHSADPLLVEAGGDRITWKRAPSSEGWGSCFGVRPLSAETRHHLLAEMLGIGDSAMLWPVRKDINVVWQSKDQFQHDLGAAVETQDAKLRETVQAFQIKGLITPEAAKSVLPKLSVTIHYSDSLNRKE